MMIDFSETELKVIAQLLATKRPRIRWWHYLTGRHIAIRYAQKEWDLVDQWAQETAKNQLTTK